MKVLKLKLFLALLTDETSLNYLNDNFVEFSSKCFFFGATEKQSLTQVASTLRDLYFKLDKIDARSFSSLNQITSDGVVGYGVHRLAHYAANYTDVYYYKFSYIGRYSIFHYPNDKPFGMHHGDDIQYTILSNFVAPIINESDPENFMVERMTRIWEQFAQKGNPNNSTDAYLSEMNWPTLDAENEYYMDIGLNLVEKQGLYLERFTVWDNLEISSANCVHKFTLVFTTFFMAFLKKLIE